MGDTTPMREELFSPELPARVAQERHPIEQCRDDLVSRAEVVRILRELGATHADLAIYGEADSARNRESAEAAFTLARCAVALMPPAFAPVNTAAVAAQLDEAAEWLAEDIPADTPEIEHLEGDVRLDELDLYCVNVMRRASAALRAKDAEIAALKEATDFLDLLRISNAGRLIAWEGDEPADALFHATELGGEVGEVLNVVKKLHRAERGWRGSSASIRDLEDELGDALICLDKLAGFYGIDLAHVTARKFNATSDKVGLPHKLPSAPVGAERDHEGGELNTFEVGKPAPYFCPACEAVPRYGYCALAGCPTTPSRPDDGG